MADPTKLQYYTEYNSYKNLGVYSGTISVTNATIAPGAVRQWDTTITVEPDSRFSSALIQANRDNFPSGVLPLTWQSFPPANTVWQTLSVDPVGAVSHDLGLVLVINGNQVTFRAEAFNPYGGNMAFNAISINFQYAIHTLDK